MSPRICIIGAGPSGMSTLISFAKMENMPDVVCYEKQSTWGGQWNCSWKTGVDENGEPVHSSMYRFMWCNGPKELYEYPDYTFDMHYGKPTPSFPSRIVMRDYLEGRYGKGAPRKRNLKDYIRFNTSVRLVKYSDEKDEFIVSVNDYNTGTTRDETFSHVVVATGIYHTPNFPEFPGLDNFEGRILHAHDFRDAREFTGKRMLIVGAGFTGEDLALQFIKFKAKSVIMAHRTRPKGDTCIMPDDIEERPNVERFDHNRAYFKDGSSAEVDCVVLATGYRNYFPFLEDRFRVPEETHLHPEGLYKASLFYKAGNNRLFYVGAIAQFNTFTYFEVIANWTCKFIMGQLKDEPKPFKEMEADSRKWFGQANAIESETDVVLFQLALMDHLAEISGYTKNIIKNKEGLLEWLRVRQESFGLANYRDNCYRSIYTEVLSPKQTPFMKNFDDSVEAYLKCT